MTTIKIDDSSSILQLTASAVGTKVTCQILVGIFENTTTHDVAQSLVVKQTYPDGSRYEQMIHLRDIHRGREFKVGPVTLFKIARVNNPRCTLEIEWLPAVQACSVPGRKIAMRNASELAFERA
jgi:hypothetical protein